MMGIEGEPAKLDPNLHGTGYINGSDNRPAATMRTKHLPEYLKPGQSGIDVRDLAERIAADPLSLDDAVLDAISPYGYTGRHQVIDGTVIDEAIDAVAADKAKGNRRTGLTLHRAVLQVTGGIPVSPPPRDSQPPGGIPAGTAPPPPGAPPVPLPLLAAVLAQRGEMDLFDVSEAAGVDALEADRLLGELAAAGLAVQTGPGRYRAATVTGRI
jgi:hypothetical protein